MDSVSSTLKVLVADDQAQMVADYIASAIADDASVSLDLATTPAGVVAKIMAVSYDLVFLDISFTPGRREGLDLLSEIRLVDPRTNIIMLSTFDDKATIKRAMELGATSYVVKSLESDLEATVFHVKSQIAKRRFLRIAAAEGRLLAANAGAVFRSARTDDALAKVAQARRATEINVLITGQTGVGKDVVARSIGRSAEGVPFVAVNCGGFSPEIVESQLFGYAKGSFTGALRDTRGFFDEANGGDIFLDEVARLSPKAQAVLLRVLESGEFHPVGSTTIRKVKVRAIAATNEDLDQAVRDGRFRKDLLARLRVITIAVPPLCERREDIRPIIDQAIASSARPSARLKPECLAILEGHSWPTNVRGLRGAIASMIALSASDLLDVGDIPPDVWSGDAEAGAPSATIASPTSILGHIEVPTALSFEKAMDLFQVRFIEAKLAALPYPRTVTSLAAALGIPRTTLIRRLRELNIEFDGDAANHKQTGGA